LSGKLLYVNAEELMEFDKATHYFHGEKDDPVTARVQMRPTNQEFGLFSVTSRGLPLDGKLILIIDVPLSVATVMEQASNPESVGNNQPPQEVITEIERGKYKIHNRAYLARVAVHDQLVLDPIDYGEVVEFPPAPLSPANPASHEQLQERLSSYSN
jgi:hypothetical protein